MSTDGRSDDEQDVNAASVSKLRQIGLCIAMYSDLHNQFLPPMNSPHATRAALMEVTSSAAIFTHAITQEPYQPNRSAAGMKWQDNPDLPVVYEASAAQDKTRAVLFNDGHVERLSPPRWEALCKTFKILTDEEEIEESRLNNLRRVGKAVLAYVADGDKRLPPLADLPAAKQALLPYLGMKDILTDPVTKASYAANPLLSRKKLAEVANPASTIVFFETQPHDQKRGVLFLDGHTEWVPETKWPELKTAAQIP